MDSDGKDATAAKAHLPNVMVALLSLWREKAESPPGIASLEEAALVEAVRCFAPQLDGIGA